MGAPPDPGPTVHGLTRRSPRPEGPGPTTPKDWSAAQPVDCAVLQPTCNMRTPNVLARCQHRPTHGPTQPVSIVADVATPSPRFGTCDVSVSSEAKGQTPGAVHLQPVRPGASSTRAEHLRGYKGKCQGVRKEHNAQRVTGHRVTTPVPGPPAAWHPGIFQISNAQRHQQRDVAMIHL